MDKKNFLNDLRNLNWETALSIAKKRVSFKKFNIIETVLDTYAPLSLLSNADQKRKQKGSKLQLERKIKFTKNSSELTMIKTNVLCIKNLKNTVSLY